MKPYALLMAATMLAGCATVGNESLTTRSEDWPYLTMTQADIIKELGPPNRKLTTVQNGHTITVLRWIYGRAELNPGLLIPIVGLLVAASGEGVETEHRSLTVTFNTQGVMQTREWAQGQTGHTEPWTPLDH